jgi:hypothetical protein
MPVITLWGLPGLPGAQRRLLDKIFTVIIILSSETHLRFRAEDYWYKEENNKQ